MVASNQVGRGFWLHQIVEYLIAAALILMSAQSRHSFVVAGYGIALLINVAIADGPLSAYKVVPRNIHRIIDWLFVVALFAGSFLLDVDQSTRTTLFAMAVAIIVIALTTNYTKKVFRQP
jgi:anaerobic C4-dicarboxylate transporter